MARDQTLRRDTLAAAIDAADRLDRLMSDPLLVRFFELQEQQLTATMINAKPSDDATRRDAALELQVWRRVRQAALHAVSNGPIARKKLEELETMNA